MLGNRNEKKKSGSRRHYMIGLDRQKSAAALLASVITLAAAIRGIVNGLIEYAADGIPAMDLFQFFTPNANSLTALAAAFIIPYAVEGIRKKRFSYPGWVARLHYSGTICTTLTMVFSVCIMSFYDPHQAFGGNNLYLHIICPVLVLVSFFLVEADNRYTQRDSILCMIPFCIYVAVYFWNVVIIGAENGGWNDLYHLTDYISVFISLPAMILMGFGISVAIRLIANRLTFMYEEKMMALWEDGLDAVEIKIEVFGLGRYAGETGEESDIIVPMDIIKMLAERYDLKTDELIRAYTKGVLEGLRDQEANSSGGQHRKKENLITKRG